MLRIPLGSNGSETGESGAEGGRQERPVSMSASSDVSIRSLVMPGMKNKVILL